VPQPVAYRAFVHQCEPRDVLPSALLRDSAPGSADHEHDLAFVVKLIRFRRPQYRLFVPDQALRRAKENARILRLTFGDFESRVFLVAPAVVDTYANDLAGIANRRQKPHVVEPVIRTAIGEVGRLLEPS